MLPLVHVDSMVSKLLGSLSRKKPSQKPTRKSSYEV